MKRSKLLNLLLLGFLTISSHLATAALQSHSRSGDDTTYMDVINDTHYYVWVTDIQQLNLFGLGKARATRTTSFGPISPKLKGDNSYTASWDHWASGVERDGWNLTRATIKFGTNPNSPEKQAVINLNLTPTGLNKTFTITSQPGFTPFRVTVEVTSELNSMKGAQPQTYNNYTIKLTQIQ